MNNPSAFPWTVAIEAGSKDPFTNQTVPPNNRTVHVQSGMDLRDYFAAAALSGLYANSCVPFIESCSQDAKRHNEESTEQTYARIAYEAADQMLKARA